MSYVLIVSNGSVPINYSKSKLVFLLTTQPCEPRHIK